MSPLFLFPIVNCCISYQLWKASFGKDPAGTVEMKMSRTPAPHIEPFHSSGRQGSIFFVEQDELLLGSHRCVLQHPLQLQQIIHIKGIWASGCYCSIIYLIQYCIGEYTCKYFRPHNLIWRPLCTLRNSNKIDLVNYTDSCGFTQQRGL